MRSTSRSVKLLSVVSMKGMKRSSETKESVCSWIWVRAWTREMTRPTRRPSSITGALISRATMMASRAMSRTSGACTRVASEGHAEDALVGLDDLVAHGDDGLECHVRIGHGSHHLGEVGLPRGGAHGELLALLEGVPRLADGVLDEIGEALPRGLGARLEPGPAGLGGGIGIGGGSACERDHGGSPLRVFRLPG